MTYEEVIEALYDLEDKEKVVYRAKKFGIISHNALGIAHKELKVIAKEIGPNDELALQLFDSGIYEGRLLCSKVFNPKNLTDALCEKWVKTFENWEVCDSFCMGIIAKSHLAIPKILEWTQREEEFEKRAGFATLAAYCMADKQASNEVYEAFLPVIKREAHDERLYVKKAVNWALRSIGKRNTDLLDIAIETAYEIEKMESKSARWIAKDAIRELTGQKVRVSDYPRLIYRK